MNRIDTSTASMDKRVNLAALPITDALAVAQHAGRTIFADREAMLHVSLALFRKWADVNMPCACGQSDEEFSELQDRVMKEFDAGLDEAIAAAKVSVPPPPGMRDLEKERRLRSVHELTAMIWGVAGLCQEDAEAKYTDAYVHRMSELAYEVERAIENSEISGAENG